MAQLTTEYVFLPAKLEYLNKYKENKQFYLLFRGTEKTLNLNNN
jgi:hypothetical protein